MKASTNHADLVDLEALRQIEAATPPGVSVESRTEDPTPLDVEPATLSDLVHIPERPSSKRPAHDAFVHLEAASEAADVIGAEPSN